MSVLLVIQIIIVVCMIAVILLQKSSSDGFTGASSSSSGLMSGRASANLLTRITSILAAAFIINSLVLAYLSSHSEKTGSLVGDSGPVSATPAGTEPEVPAEGAVDAPKAAPEPALPDELPAALPEEKPADKKGADNTSGSAPAKPAPEVPVEQ